MVKNRNIRRRRRPETKYLVQEREGQEDRVLVYTEALAKRKDMFPISAEEAMEIQREKYPDLFEKVETVEEKTADANPDTVADQTGPDVIAEAAAAGAEEEEGEDDFIDPSAYDNPAPKTDPKNVINIDPDTDPEIQMIRGFTTKNQLESYLLFQHKLEIDTGKKKLKDLVEDAISIVIAKRMENTDGES